LTVTAQSSRANDSSEATYARLAPIYDVIYGIGLQHGRLRALTCMALEPGESVLEIGVGTGLGVVRYPPGSPVIGIDLSLPMLARAQARLRRQEVCHVKLCRMDASRLAFRDEQFDVVYAPYVINVVPDPVRVAHEMIRVCKRGGRLVFLNHFHDRSQATSVLERMIGRVAQTVTGVSWNLDLGTFLARSGLTAMLIERVNVPRVSSVVVCGRPLHPIGPERFARAEPSGPLR
jgi:phosphatidylethanolamine/phosphatidyl-N-methylethanolamine N-methyltransferase